MRIGALRKLVESGGDQERQAVQELLGEEAVGRDTERRERLLENHPAREKYYGKLRQ